MGTSMSRWTRLGTRPTSTGPLQVAGADLACPGASPTLHILFKVFTAFSPEAQKKRVMREDLSRTPGQSKRQLIGLDLTGLKNINRVVLGIALCLFNWTILQQRILFGHKGILFPRNS